MVGVVTVAQALGGVVLLLANGFFVGIEFAMTRVRQFSESEFQGSTGLERAWEMTDRLEIYLSGCQLGITISSVGLGVVAEPAVTALLHAALVQLNPVLRVVGVGTIPATGSHTTVSVLLALGLINILHVVVGEQAPTYFGVERTRTAAKYGAPVLYWWVKLTWPVIAVADWTAKALLSLFGVTITRSWAEEEIEGGDGESLNTRAEVRSRIGEVLSQGRLSEERRQEVMNALAIGEMTVSEIAVPTDDVVALSTDDSVERNLERMRENPHVRFPLVGADIEDYHGVVYVPEVFRNLVALENGEVSLHDLSSAPMTLAADTSVSDAIDQFQLAGEELALVVDDGAVVGLLTPTDAWECITGEMHDPLDEETAAA